MGMAVKRPGLSAYAVQWPRGGVRRINGYGVNWPRQLGDVTEGDAILAELQASATPGDFAPFYPTPSGSGVYHYGGVTYVGTGPNGGPGPGQPGYVGPVPPGYGGGIPTETMYLPPWVISAMPSGESISTPTTAAPGVLAQAQSWLGKSTVIAGTANSTVLFGGLAVIALLAALSGGKRRR